VADLLPQDLVPREAPIRFEPAGYDTLFATRSTKEALGVEWRQAEESLWWAWG
jgi:hypothetical protein